MQVLQRIYILYKDSFRTSRRTQFAAVRKTSLWMLYKEMVCAFCKSNVEQLNCVEKKCWIFSVKPGGIYTYHKL